MVSMHPEHCPPEIKRLLLDAFERRHDPEVLTPLLRISTDVSDIAPMLLDALSRLNDAQGFNRRLREQARVFERLVTTDLPQAVELAKRYPTPFVYGIGRARQAAATDYVVSILEAARQTHVSATSAVYSLLTDGSAMSSDEYRASAEIKAESAECLRLGIWALGKLQARDILVAWARDYGVSWFEGDGSDEVEEREP